MSSWTCFKCNELQRYVSTTDKSVFIAIYSKMVPKVNFVGACTKATELNEPKKKFYL